MSSRAARRTTAARIVKRSLITGLNSTGVDVADLRVLPAAVGRHLLKMHGYAAGFHVGTSTADPEVVQIRFFEQPGIELPPAQQKEVEKHFFRQDFRRAPASELGDLDYPPRVGEAYAEDLLGSLDVASIRERRFRIVVDYGYSAASAVLPLLLEPLHVEAVSAHAVRMGDSPPATTTLRETIGQSKRLVGALGADLAVVFDRAAERLYLVDELGHEIGVDRVLLLFVRLLASNGRRGKLAFPVTVTSQVETLTSDSELEVVRTPASLAELTKAAAQEGVVFAGALSGGYVFPEFLPAYDAVASLCKLLELLAQESRPLSQLVAELPETDARPPPAPVSVEPQGAGHAGAGRAAQGTRAGSRRRREALHGPTAGCRCCPTRTSRLCTSTRKERRTRTPRSSRRSSGHSWRTFSCRDRRSRLEARISTSGLTLRKGSR